MTNAAVKVVEPRSLELKEIKEQDIEMCEVLNKVKPLVLLVNDAYITTEMAASYYDVNIEAINSLIKDHRYEISEDGKQILNGERLREFKHLYQIKSRARSLALLPIKSILRIAMLLRDSNIASRVRDNLLSTNPKLYSELNKRINMKKYEVEMKELLHKLLGKYNQIESQVSCDNYLIDFVINNSIAIEVDENGHSGYNQINDYKRTKTILSKGYKLLRYDTRKNDMLSFIGEVIHVL